ncbi:MAG: hypothetical protein ACLRZ9_05765 [Eubacterium sp.]
MKKYPVGMFGRFNLEKGMFCADFSCPACGKKYTDIVLGGPDYPKKCECGCEFEEVRF